MPKAFPEEFRQRVVEAARESDLPSATVAREFRISQSYLSRWLKEDRLAKAAPSSSHSASQTTTTLAVEIELRWRVVG